MKCLSLKVFLTVCLIGGTVVALLLMWGLTYQIPSAPAVPSDSDRAISVLGYCTTTLNADEENRNDNVALGAEMLDGTVIEPGAEFSFNEATGERDAEQGYKPARVIVDGKNEPGIAGGICQLSSTLYNAALLSGMEIVERHPHSRPVPYLPAGLDATVSYGARDLKWMNTSDSEVTLRAKVEGARLEVWIEGEGPGPDVNLLTEVVQIIEPRPMAPPNPTGRSVAPPRPEAGNEIKRGVSGYRIKVWAETPGPSGGRVRKLISDDLYEPVHAVVD